MRVPVPDILLPADRLGRVHFVGIGGAGLSAIARLMLGRGVPVTGSDQADSPTLDALRRLGAQVYVGHAAAQVGAADTVVVSTAVREDNPEVLEAARRGLRLLPRSAALAAVMSGRRVLAVAGTHGKTTTTSLLVAALQAAGLDPAYAVGGDLAATGTNAEDGAGDLFVAEADESDGAFLVYTPYAAVVTTVDADHLDQWGTEEAYRAAFARFVDRIDPGGFLVVWADSAQTRALAARARDRGLRVVSYGESPDADWQPRDIRTAAGRTTFVAASGGSATPLALRIPGRHYLHNALAAFATGVELGADPDRLAAGLAGFAGTRRRMELVGEAGGVRVYDSYAHHPREIAGDLEAARSVAGEGRVVVVFQPHLVTRTRRFGVEMGRALGAADEALVLDVYLAREDPDESVTGRLVADAVPLAPGRVEFVDGLERVPAAVRARVARGDLVLTLGAGDVTTLAPRILEALGAAG